MDSQDLIQITASPSSRGEDGPSIIAKGIVVGAPHLHLVPDQIYPFDARGIAKRFRHAAIFGAFEALRPGEIMRFVNDHDPLPLLNQFRERYGAKVAIEYRQREPGAIVIDFAHIDAQ